MGEETAVTARRGDGRKSAIHEVAALAGVSIATVSRVVNGNTSKVSEETRKRVETVIEAVNYRPSSAGSNLRRGTSRILAVMINDRESSYNLAIAASIEAAANRDGKVIILCATQDSPERQDEFLTEMQSQLACGIVMIGAVKSRGLKVALASKLPIVFVNRRSPFAVPAPYVGVDNVAASGEIATHFRAQGWNTATIFHGPRISLPTDERVRGFESVFLGDKTSGVKASKHAMPDFKMASAYKVACDLLDANKLSPNIFCTNDELAYGVARACREHGLDLEMDVNICGFEGNPYNPYVAPWLSTIHAPSTLYGEKVLEILKTLWRGEEITTQPEIMIPYERRFFPSKGRLRP